MKPIELKQLRIKAGLTLKEMAKIMGENHRQRVHYLENGTKELEDSIKKKVLKYVSGKIARLKRNIMELKKVEDELKKDVDKLS